MVCFVCVASRWVDCLFHRVNFEHHVSQSRRGVRLAWGLFVHWVGTESGGCLCQAQAENSLIAIQKGINGKAKGPRSKRKKKKLKLIRSSRIRCWLPSMRKSSKFFIAKSEMGNLLRLIREKWPNWEVLLSITKNLF